MSFRITPMLPVASVCLAALTLAVSADPEMLPPPRAMEDLMCPKFSPAEFEDALARMKSEREALARDRKSTDAKRVIVQNRAAEPDLRNIHNKLKKALDFLQEERDAPAPAEPPPALVKIPAKPPEPKAKDDTHDAGPTTVAKIPVDLTTVDPVALGQMLMRSGKYEQSLEAFRKVDLQGKKSIERMPIVYLTASCLLRLDKVDEAIPLLRDVANSRGDENMAAYAQWQLELLRWKRDINDRLVDIRTRRAALEKKS
jgi:tetratricopeptide (TPR) repeat protein